MADDQLLDRLTAAGAVELTPLTDEELESVSADEGTPFRPAEPPEVTRSLPDDVRGVVLRTALRSLVLRGLVREPDDEQLAEAAASGRLALQARGDLDSILSVRRSPTGVVFVGQASYLAAVHGFQDQGVTGFLEELIDRRGFHRFTLRTLENAVDELARVVDPGELTPPSVTAGAGPRGDVPEQLTDSLRELGPGITRIDAYHLRPAGSRRTQVSIAVSPEGTSVVRSVFGVAPEPANVVTVDRSGLRQAILAVLSDQDQPAAEPDGAGPRQEEGSVSQQRYQCPVCGYPDLTEPPYTEESGASYDICPSCGFEFGYDDEARGVTFEEWRAKWIAGGMRWSSRGVSAPPGWDPRAQLRALGVDVE
jgi:hypothetical protein